MRPAWIAVALSLTAGSALAADPSVILRTGEHPGFGRVVFDTPPGVSATPMRQGDSLIVHFTQQAGIQSGARPPHNIRDIEAAPGQVTLNLTPGARIRQMRIGGRLVIDVLKPAPEGGEAIPPRSTTHRTRTSRSKRPITPTIAPTDTAADTPADTAETKPAVELPPAPTVIPSPTAQPAATSPITAPVAPVAQAPLADSPSPSTPPPASSQLGSLALSAAAAPVAPGASGHAMTVPFDAGVGAAAFRQGDSAIIVFDQPRPIDMAPLHDDPVFGAGAVQLLPGATVLRLPLAPGTNLRLARVPAGWTITASPSTASAPGVFPAANDGPPLHPIRLTAADGAVRLAADAPGQVIPVPDPETGGIILVGTQRQPGEALVVARHTPEMALLPGWQGVALLPISDSLSLRTTPQGFLIEAGAGRALAMGALDADAEAQADAEHLTRRFDFPDLPPEALRRRLLTTIDDAAATPAQSRGPKRIAVARAMLSLGMGAEAQAVLALTATDDPRLTDDPDRRALSAMAALIAGRPGEANALDDPSLTGTDEIALWRAVRSAMAHEGAAKAAPIFAADIALPLAYPDALRDRLLPLMAETMALGGEWKAAKRLLDRRPDTPDDHSLDLARGFVAEAETKDSGASPQKALDIYDKVAAGHDQLASARASVRAVELRMARAGVSPAQGADALERLLYAWRGDGREPALRQRIAELRRAAGQWRAALAMLRESQPLFPERRPAFQAQLVSTFAGALAADAAKPLPPLDLVALAEDNADLIPDGDAGQALASRLADRLAMLDLPDRAIPVLEKLASATPAGPGRAAIGGRIAAMRLAQGDASGALAALAASAADCLPPALDESRSLIFARAAAAKGDLAGATAVLARLDTQPAVALRADLLEAAKDWPAAVAALRDEANGTLPAQGVLTETQSRLMLRLASAAAQAGDETTLASLRQNTLPRLPTGQLAEMFRVLTQGPVTGVADLPRAANEVRFARALPSALNTLTP